jgi:hypothetical protein
MTPILVLGLFLAAGLSIPISFFSRRALKKRESELQVRLKGAGRFLEWNELQMRWLSGEGTLIVQDHFPKGPGRIWWTQDDLLTMAPMPVPKEEALESELPEPLKEYALKCSTNYLGLDSGLAKLTELPAELRRDGKLYELAPKGRVVTILKFPDWYEISQGIRIGF